MSVLPKVKYFLLCCIGETGTTRLTNEIELYSIFNHVNHGKVKSLRVFLLTDAQTHLDHLMRSELRMRVDANHVYSRIINISQ